MELDATSLIDVDRLQAEVTAMYRHVARGDDGDLHFEIGRPLAERLGYPTSGRDRAPTSSARPCSWASSAASPGST